VKGPPPTFAKPPPRRVASAARLASLGIGAAMAVFAGALCPVARAQVAASVSLDSDDRLRGVSLSDGRPVATLALAYDAPDGAYGGVSGAATQTSHDGPQPLSYVVYLGYAGSLGPGASWDVGVTNSGVAAYADRTYVSHYTEIYAGFTRGELSGHIYYSPRYLFGAQTIYLELDGIHRLGDHWRLAGHVGLLTPLSRSGDASMDAERVDLRAGIVREFKHCELRLALTSTAPAPVYPIGDRQARTAVVAGLGYFF
jgi:uncharacterized protein (TIGR02001 family)